MAKTTPESEQLVKEFLDRSNKRDYSKLPEILSESYVMVDPAAPAGEVHGPEGFEAWLREIVRAFPDFEMQIVDSLASDEVVMVEIRYTGTHEGEFNGLPPTGREIEFQGIEKYQVAGGKIQRTRAYFHDQELKDQLGLTFPEVMGQLPTLVWGKLQQRV